MSRTRSYAFLVAIAGIVVVVDRITKIVIERRFGVGYGPRQIVDHVLFLEVTRNAGAAFGIFQNFTFGFLVISAVVMVAILIYYWRLPQGDWTARLGLSLVFGGALSNAYDRAVKGSVIDFIKVPHWPIFNVADSAVTVGVAVLLIGTLWASRQPHRSTSNA
ncbi:MAG TPA: signal peptidase II [Candidatus Dormibacteraeota bacterium]|nr:signal peptidase II [Candidatus Dormibacteraeota bacterium]